nr:hypothetical protein [Mycobacteroides abscessus]
MAGTGSTLVVPGPLLKPMHSAVRIVQLRANLAEPFDIAFHAQDVGRSHGPVIVGLSVKSSAPPT